jgi:hypothetical protein
MIKLIIYINHKISTFLLSLSLSLFVCQIRLSISQAYLSAVRLVCCRSSFFNCLSFWSASLVRSGLSVCHVTCAHTNPNYCGL